jgi:CRP/FNR family cyclic AMP-dependent transcriptional regulator
LTPTPLLDALRAASADQPPASGKRLRAREGQALFHDGDPSDEVYLLVSGEVRLAVVGKGEGERTTLLCRAPALVGDRDLLADTPAREAGLCLTACELYLFGRAQLFAELKHDPLRAWLHRDLAVRYVRSLELQRLSAHTLTYRVAAFLRDAAERQVAAPGTRYLCSVLGATDKAVLRSLSSLRSGAGPDADALDGVGRIALFHSLVAEL